MAVITSGSFEALDFRDSDISSYSFLNLTARRPNYIAGDYRLLDNVEQRVEFFGNGFQYSQTGAPFGGTVTRIRESFAGQLLFDASGLSVSVATLNFWVRNSLTDEALSSLLSGSDQISGSPFDDFVLGYSGSDLITLGAGVDEAYGGPGNDVITGGPGFDTARFTGSAADYEIVTWGSTTGIVPRNAATLEADGIDKALDVEQVGFDADFVTLPVGITNFSPLEYIASHPDLSASLGADPVRGFDHYIYGGVYEGRSSSFSGLEYLAASTDLAAVFGTNAESAAAHYISNGRAEGRTIGFDGLEYNASYPDLVRALGTNSDAGVLHYLSNGRFEGRTIRFDALEYTASHRDLILAFGANEMIAVTHYLTRGFSEGRTVSFDSLRYIASHPDLIPALGANEHAGALHYISAGHREGRLTDLFDAAQYLVNYPDLRLAFGNDTEAATLHYIQSGFAENRRDDPISFATDFTL